MRRLIFTLGLVLLPFDVRAVEVTTLTTRTVVDTTHSDISTDSLVVFMNAHADQLTGMTPMGLIVSGSDTSVIVKGLPKDPMVYTKDGWQRIRRLGESASVVKVSRYQARPAPNLTRASRTGGMRRIRWVMEQQECAFS